MMKAKDFYEKKLKLISQAHDAFSQLGALETRAPAPDEEELKFFDKTCDNLYDLTDAVVAMVDMYDEGDR